MLPLAPFPRLILAASASNFWNSSGFLPLVVIYDIIFFAGVYRPLLSTPPQAGGYEQRGLEILPFRLGTDTMHSPAEDADWWSERDAISSTAGGTATPAGGGRQTPRLTNH